jgi:hypothetical protein
MNFRDTYRNNRTNYLTYPFNMKTLAEKVFDRLNERNPDLLAEVIDEIENEEREHRDSTFIYNDQLDTDIFGNCYSDADPGL